MKIYIDNKSESPIYSQIYTQIKNQIINGSIGEDELLPSIRTLAKDLKISFITTKRAYDELENDNYIYTIPGKGCYVNKLNSELVKEENLKKIEKHIEDIKFLASSVGLNKKEVNEIIKANMEDYNERNWNSEYKQEL